MTDLAELIKADIDSALAGQEPTRGFDDVVARSRRLRLRYRLGVIALALLLGGAVVLVAPRLWGGSNVDTVQRDSEVKLPVPEGYSLVARGDVEGEPWLFSISVKDGKLCSSWQYKEPSPGNTICGNSLDHVGAAYFHRMSANLPSDPGALVGAISTKVARVELRLTDGATSQAGIYRSPPELQLGFKWFVGFTPPNADVVVAVIDEDGNVLAREHFRSHGELTEEP